MQTLRFAVNKSRRIRDIFVWHALASALVGGLALLSAGAGALVSQRFEDEHDPFHSS